MQMKFAQKTERKWAAGSRELQKSLNNNDVIFKNKKKISQLTMLTIVLKKKTTKSFKDT